MEFIALDQEGRKLSPDPSPSDISARQNLYKVRSVDIRLAFRSENEFFRFEAREGNCLLYTSPSPRDHPRSRMPSSA